MTGAAVPTVAVIMSTYNGEEYLREQLDSILAQEGVNVELYIRDDGSSERTSGKIYTRSGASSRC
ncbi:MAG: glycosyltransferase [Synergistaceae bacterium]|nr:glycosyltransferase [Synergistaceae bacterium]